MITQNCVCYTNSCINLLVLDSVIRGHHTKVLELLDILQCIAAYLQQALACVFG